MTPGPDLELTKSHTEQLHCPQSPDADYGLRHGFDPAKYDFYNPISHKARKALAGRLEDEQTATRSGEDDGEESHGVPYDPGTSVPLSTIEELEDEAQSLRPRHNFDSGLLTSSKDGPPKQPRIADSGHASLDEGTRRPLTLERRTDLLFSRQHLQAIFADGGLSMQFTNFLRTHRPASLPILTYYLNATMALKTIRTAESIIRALEPIPGHSFTAEASSATMAWVMEDKADRALDVLVRDDMPAFVAHLYVKMVDMALVDRVTGKEDPTCMIAEGLAEVFVLSDPARPDNPIVFSSEEFHTLTGWSRKDALGQNGRILDGERTSALGIGRFRASLDAEREHCEILLNYRRDGSPFINLIMSVPLRDRSDRVRYYLGAHVDITELVKNCTELSSLRRVIEQEEKNTGKAMDSDLASDVSAQDEFKESGETLSPQKLGKVVMLGRRKPVDSESGLPRGTHREEEVILATPSTEINGFQLDNQRIAPALGFYQNYLLVRPHPSLRILFASPDLCIPELLQQPLMNSIGGSLRVRQDLARALEVGRKVTAKVQWLSKSASKSNASWIHCTPLLGSNDSIGVWMVILVDADEDNNIRTDAETPKLKAPTTDSSGDNYSVDAIPWDNCRKNNSLPGVSNTIRGESERNVPDDQTVQSKPTRAGSSPGRGGKNAPDKVNAALRQGASVGSTIGSHASVDHRLPSRDERPSSQSSSIIPIRTQLQPTIKIAGRTSFDGSSTKPPPIQMPGQQEFTADDDPDGIRPARKRTYKSLSPYGIIFNE